MVHVFVTDYSSNMFLGDHFAAPELSDRAMKIELTGTSDCLAELMKPGSFWFLRNCKVNGGSNSILEGRLCEKKGVRQLNVSDSSHEVHLKALLRYT